MSRNKLIFIGTGAFSFLAIILGICGLAIPISGGESVSIGLFDYINDLNALPSDSFPASILTAARSIAALGIISILLGGAGVGLSTFVFIKDLDNRVFLIAVILLAAIAFLFGTISLGLNQNTLNSASWLADQARNHAEDLLNNLKKLKFFS